MELVHTNLLCKNNWVMILGEYSEIITQVSDLMEDGIVTTTGECALWEDVYGIELTPDWLQVAGFVQQADGVFHRRDFACTILAHDYYSVQFRDAQLAGIRFVHELQQLYGAIKQRELVIPLPATNA